jgi:DNA-binding MarR family transcriptional regulator
MSDGGDHVARLFRVFNEIGILAQLSGTTFERVMPEGLNLPQFVVLNHMVRLGDDRTPVELARAMQVTKGTMTNTVGHLERAGFVEVRPDGKDGRSKRVGLTAAGRGVRDAAIAALAPELEAIGAHFPPERVDGLLPQLEVLRRILDDRRG